VCQGDENVERETFKTSSTNSILTQAKIKTKFKIANTNLLRYGQKFNYMQPIKIENFLNFKALLWYFRKVYT
jgi:hypothetical protein